MDSESDEWSDSSTDSDLEHLKPKTLVNVPPSMQKKLLKSKYYLPPEMKRPTVELCDGETQTMISGSLQMKLCFTESGQRKKKKMKIRRYGVNVRHSGSQTTSTGIVFSVERDGIGGKL